VEKSKRAKSNFFIKERRTAFGYFPTKIPKPYLPVKFL
jgi:hypothetical protein